MINLDRIDTKLKVFFRQKRQISYKKGETIIRLGDIPSGVYFIEEGCVKAYTTTESGEENIDFLLKPGDVFPVIWVLTGKIPQEWYEALTPTLLHRTPRETLLTFLHQEQESLFSLTRFLADIYETLIGRVHNLQQMKATARIITRLIFLARYFGNERNGRIEFDIPITQQDIARSINATRETTSKEINRLAKKGILECDGYSSLVIYNLDKLQEELLLQDQK